MAAPHDSTDDNKTDPAMAETPAAGVPEVNDEEVVLDPIEQLQADLAAALAQVAEQKDQALRAHAEMENVRRRAQEEVSKARKFGIESFAEGLVPVKDSLEAALAQAEQTAGAACIVAQQR